ncbi:M48 family metallopeptidase [Bifidobacterium callimiconis]|nr:M48 family metallopeptidase [Bifidobacterium callimiconis]
MGDLHIRVARKVVKNIYLRIKPPDGRVEITAPVRMSHTQIEEFVRSRRQWIHKAQRRILDHAARFGRVPDDGYAGHTNPFGNGPSDTGQNGRGADVDNHKNDDDPRGRLNRYQPNHRQTDTAIPATPRPPFGAPWSAERKTWAKAVINARLPELLRKWTPIVGKAPTNVSLRAMTSRWGSCTPATGRIRLNLELAYLPERYLEYVLVHELTHLWEHGHGEGFRRRMTAYLPEWRRLRRELNQLV